MIIDQLRVPVVLAPLAGGPSAPQLAAAVTEAGGLGFLAAGYLAAGELGSRLATARGLTSGPLGVNVFSPGSGPTPPEVYAGYVQRLRDWGRRNGAEIGEPRYSDDDWDAKLELLRQQPPAVVSFTFGCPPPDVVAAQRAAGSEVWVTVTSPEEAKQAADAGADAVVAQGAEAGGHRGSFADGGADDEPPLYGVLALVSLIRAQLALPVVASGGIATGAALAAVLCAGASAGQIGTAFMLAPEAGTSEPHRAALRTSRPTGLTRAFSGRLARGIRNGFMAEHDAHAPAAYPEIHYVTAAMRRRAREQGDGELVNLWAGEAHALAREAPAGEIVAELAAQAREALEAAGSALARAGSPSEWSSPPG